MQISARELLTDLEGRVVHTLSGRRNRILQVSGDTVLVATDRSPAGRPVPIAEVQDAIDRLYQKGEIEVSVASVGYRSAFVGAVLAALPHVQVFTRPRRIKLARKADDD